MAELDNLLGSRISLISQLDIRYDGILFSINAKESSIVLRDVKCLGTEDRVTDKSKQVPATQSAVAFVSFPGHEIKDLYVHDTQTSADEPSSVPTTSSQNNLPPPPQQQHDKASEPSRRNNPPLSRSNNNYSSTSSNNQQYSRPSRAPVNNIRGPSNSNRGPPPPPRDGTENQRGGGSGRGRGQPGQGPAAGTGEHLLRMRVRRNANGTTEGGPDNTTGEFDFNEGLDKFNKEEIAATKVTDSAVETPKAPAYKKDDFFDNFAGEEESEGGRPTGRMTASDERSLNQDTFGAIALQSNYRRFNIRGGGRGRGGSGYGRGRGGGSYNDRWTNSGGGGYNNSGGYGGRSSSGGGRGRGGGGRGRGPPPTSA